MRILILNRRDIANPAGGGAEVYTHEIARGLVRKYNCSIVVFTSRFDDSPEEEMIDGVVYVRRGNEATAHLRGFVYAVQHRKKFDIIIDEFNGLGFFTFPLKKSLLLIHQLYREFWFRELSFAGVVPYVLEPLFLRAYRKRPAVTVSESTKKDLEDMGFGQVRVVMNAISRPPAGRMDKDARPTVVFLGRLRSTKQPGDAIEIFRGVKKRVPDARLWIIGSGPLENVLKKDAGGLDGVTFQGRVDDRQKFELLSRAHVLVVPSVREGFGINVIEAASAGCPAVGYNVPGLRDSIRHGETGYLTNSSEDSADRIVELITDRALFEKMSRNCLEYSKEFVWEKRVDEFWEIVMKA
ncbi:MAG: glycosyltransferase family 4 protein [Nitrospirae bacterium]|nr:glycosyltransferase family 4 protein [Nitrospirota bacterium]